MPIATVDANFEFGGWYGGLEIKGEFNDSKPTNQISGTLKAGLKEPKVNIATTVGFERLICLVTSAAFSL